MSRQSQERLQVGVLHLFPVGHVLEVIAADFLQEKSGWNYVAITTGGSSTCFSPHSNSLYFCWSRKNHDVLCKPRDQHPISRPGDQYHDQHLFLTGNTHLRPHMTNSGTNFCDSPLIAPVAPGMFLRPSWAIHIFGARPLSVLAGDIPVRSPCYMHCVAVQ